MSGNSRQNSNNPQAEAPSGNSSRQNAGRTQADRRLHRLQPAYESFILLVTLYDVLQLVYIDSSLSSHSVALQNRRTE